MKKLHLFTLLLAACAQLSCAASFDCAKASTATEKLICSDAKVSALDEQLSVAYKAASETATDKDALKAQQRDWLKQKRNTCGNVECLTQVYQARINELTISKTHVAAGNASLDANSKPKEVIDPVKPDANLVIKGKTPEERIEFLSSIADEAESRSDWEYRNKYFSKALSDSSPDVRKYAAYRLRGSNYVAQLIHVLVSDSESEVRQSASIGLSGFLTDNGSSTCGDSKTVEQNLVELMKGLSDAATSMFVVEILGAGVSGDTPMPCCMSKVSKLEIISALNKLKLNVPYQPDSREARSTLKLVDLALGNIAECKK